MAEQQESVPLFPGLEDPECVAEASKAQARMDEMKSNIYNLMIALLAAHPTAKQLKPIFLDDEEITEVQGALARRNRLRGVFGGHVLRLRVDRGAGSDVFCLDRGVVEHPH
jgi:hypothetical protein